MAIDAKIDRIDTMEMTIRHGAVVHLVRRMRVINLVNTDWTVMISAMDQVGIPEDQSTLVEAPNLILVEKKITLVDNTTADVDCTYDHVFNDGQEFGSPALGVFTGKVRTTAQETTANKDIDGKGITLEHTWPSTDKDNPDKTDTQGGEFKVFQMQRTLRYEGIKQTPVPGNIPLQITGTVNKVTFCGGAPRTWMCTACDWEPFDAQFPSRYRFAFEFQHNPDTWDPTIYFVDPRTGKPPVNLVPGKGIKTIRVHRETDFRQIMGTVVQGG